MASCLISPDPTSGWLTYLALSGCQSAGASHWHQWITSIPHDRNPVAFVERAGGGMVVFAFPFAPADPNGQKHPWLVIVGFNVDDHPSVRRAGLDAQDFASL